MANIYKGRELKFSIELTAEGFSMDTMDFDIEVASPRNSVIGYKTSRSSSSDEPNPDLIIFKDSDSSSSDSSGDDGTWFCIVDTAKLSLGSLRVIATAHIQDANANDGIRNEIAVAPLGTLIDP